MTVDEQIRWAFSGHHIGRHAAALNMLAQYEGFKIADAFGTRLGHTTHRDEIYESLYVKHPLFARLEERACEYATKSTP